ncbi:putative DNA repair protein Pso2/Snm1 [Aspergillus uvarum CBS 121591]|uniref:Putative DNA repair protein Pso2/Snm1 n=1 Tax=Aspergillus uvarum CBS 121591 TaxID=1448315 RepID=A0A319BYM4_9EURO|nr:putative DNA repair protein Pso2/Snm1 [Aspergillus uvarum CBS 121591]PYH78806.1 putative DNA repair protein Pso2/Snm1 [Aspergillus uvarum CBS 121591]
MAGSATRKGSTPAKVPFSAKSQTPAKRNGSLLNFFQKADGPPKATSTQPRITQFATKTARPTSNGHGSTPTLRRQGSSTASNGAGDLFLEDKNRTRSATYAPPEPQRTARSRTPDDIWEGEPETPAPATAAIEEARYNENGSSGVKKRKLDSPSAGDDAAAARAKPSDDADATPVAAPAKKSRHLSGPFIDESDSEEEEDLEKFRDYADGPSVALIDKPIAIATESPVNAEEADPSAKTRPTPAVETPPSLVRETTSYTEPDEDTNFDDMEDEFRGEENFLDAFDDDDDDDDGHNNQEREVLIGLEDYSNGPDDDGNTFGCEVPICPICQTSLTGLNEADVSVHVNDCLDGKPSTIQPRSDSTGKFEPGIKSEPEIDPDPEIKLEPEPPSKALARLDRAAIARPAQRDPYTSGGTAARSAFSKLMAGNAEDSAWAAAAANEVASRGKQAYQRTCPFYKIMPGFSICVDAFRYGAVEGCNAYFLSHFHSDHYIGLTGSWRHGPIYCSRATANLVCQQLKVNRKWLVPLEFEKKTEIPGTGGAHVTIIEANHCPGSAIFLFEKTMGSGPSKRTHRVLHCGDFRASPLHVQHALLRPEVVDLTTGQRRQQHIDACYLDTTYLSPKYAFPSQEDVIQACADLCVELNEGQQKSNGLAFGSSGRSPGIGGGLMSKFVSKVTGSSGSQSSTSNSSGRLLVVIGTYSIGKERICLGVARALQSKIFATPAKQRICACLEDPELSALLTDNPREAQVHMQTLFEIRAETLADYLDTLKPHFTKVVGFRPTGWTYRPPAGRVLDNPPVSTVLHSAHWQTPFSARDLVPQRGSTRESACFGVPYSEHSSFRELTMFCCALRIGRVIPTVNVGSQKSRERMKAWVERWEAEKRKSGLYQVKGDRW